MTMLSTFVSADNLIMLGSTRQFRYSSVSWPGVANVKYHNNDKLYFILLNYTFCFQRDGYEFIFKTKVGFSAKTLTYFFENFTSRSPKQMRPILVDFLLAILKQMRPILVDIFTYSTKTITIIFSMEGDCETDKIYSAQEKIKQNLANRRLD